VLNFLLNSSYLSSPVVDLVHPAHPEVPPAPCLRCSQLQHPCPAAAAAKLVQPALDVCGA
jgi:hypothetical protein